MTTYVDPFGGGAVTPTPSSYQLVTFTGADITLLWPGYADAANDPVVADTIDVTGNAVGQSLTLPDARVASPGLSIVLNNLGANTLTIKNSASGVITTIATGQSAFIYLTDNSTAAGTWRSLVFGVSVGTLSLAAAAGYGLKAVSTQLEVDFPTTTLGTDFTIDATNRASTLVWTGGAGTCTLPVASSLGSGFFFALRNEGTGTLTVAAAGGEFIDTSSTITLQPEESCLVYTTGSSNWYTVGRGRNQQFNFTLLIKGVTGGTVTLTPTEASNVVQRYTGALVSNCQVVLPSVVQVYYVSNQTSGAFTLTFKTAGVGTTVTVPTGQNAILFCDGTNVINTSTTLSGLTSLLIDPGSVSAPSIAYNGDASTGIFQPVSGSVSIAGVGTEIARFNSVATAVNRIAFTNAVAGGRVAITTAGADANVGLNLAGKGTGTVRINNNQFEIPDGSDAAPSFTFTSDLTTGVFKPAAGAVGIALAGVEFARFQTSSLLLGPTALNAGFQASSLNIINSTARAISIGNTATDSVAKSGRVALRHYLSNTEEDFALIGGAGAAATNTVQIGGGSGTLNAATNIAFYTAPNNVTLTGTSQMGIDATGQVTMTAGLATTGSTSGTLVVTGGIGLSGAVFGAGGATFTGTAGVVVTAGPVLVGTVTPYAVPLGGATITPAVQNHGTTVSLSAYSAGHWNTNSSGPQFAFTKSRGAAVGTQGLVQTGDFLGIVNFAGSDGTSFLEAARVAAYVDGVAAAGVMYGRLEFSTQNGGAAASTLRMRIDADGQVNVLAGKGSTSATTGSLVVTGGVGASGSIYTSANLFAVGTTGRVGYAAGAGSTVAQATSKSTGVTLNRPTGQITMNGAALAAGAVVSFTFTNSTIEADDVPVFAISSGASAGAYTLQVDAVAAGSCRVSVRNQSGGSLSEAIVLNYAIFAGANA